MEECARCVHETIEAFGGIDVIIGNAVSSAPNKNLPCQPN